MTILILIWNIPNCGLPLCLMRCYLRRPWRGWTTQYACVIQQSLAALLPPASFPIHCVVRNALGDLVELSFPSYPPVLLSKRAFLIMFSTSIKLQLFWTNWQYRFHWYACLLFLCTTFHFLSNLTHVVSCIFCSKYIPSHRKVFAFFSFLILWVAISQLDLAVWCYLNGCFCLNTFPVFSSPSFVLASHRREHCFPAMKIVSSGFLISLLWCFCHSLTPQVFDGCSILDEIFLYS